MAQAAISSARQSEFLEWVSIMFPATLINFPMWAAKVIFFTPRETAKSRVFPTKLLQWILSFKGISGQALAKSSP
jgi:hypothetical protein